jgi:hypothetical protein
MKGSSMVDRYTKVVLTIIAACLIVIAFRDVAPEKALAQSGPVHVIIDSVNQFAYQFVTLKVTQ